jgi:hypothetical protein
MAATRFRHPDLARKTWPTQFQQLQVLVQIERVFGRIRSSLAKKEAHVDTRKVTICIPESKNYKLAAGKHTN